MTSHDGSGAGIHDAPPLHGFHLPPGDHRLLRGRPPARALRWVEDALGPGARVRSVRALPGGISSAVHALAVEDGAGRPHRVVLRRFVRPNLLITEPYLADREATALAFLEGAPLPTPRLLAADPDGEATGVPAVLMTRLPGRIEWRPRDLEAFLRRLAEPLPVMHALAVPPDTPIPAYEPYELEMRRPPRWSSQPDTWWRAMDVHGGPPPVARRHFIHRDYHPGNVLWSRGRVTGIVDWMNASIGSPEADVGHCRMNLASQLGQPAADRFLAIYEELTGRRGYHPYWDIVAAVGGMDESWDEEPNPAREGFIARAVARL
ncbi:MAG: phosphotransferase [Chloroflexi bacterium]|nr:phosphotransferase [Chloroflexota bacterium]